MTRLYALKNTWSGVAGEVVVAASLIRAGLRVAKPYWTDDAVDLLVFWDHHDDLIPIRVQVKSVQAIHKKKNGVASVQYVVPTQGLRKRYIESHSELCLAVYAPERDKIWFFPGADAIKDVHQDGVNMSNASKGRKRTPYGDIKPDGVVPIYVNVSKAGNAAFDQKWLLDRMSPTSLCRQITSLAEAVVERRKRVWQMAAFSSAGLSDGEEKT